MDIGGNIGTYSIGIASLGAKKIYTIEPGPYFAKLLKNIARNNLSHIIEPHQIGIAKAEGTLKWFEDLDNVGNAHLLHERDRLVTEKISTKLCEIGSEVNVMPLDKFVTDNEIHGLDLIKIDIEGMEWEAIQSGAKSISKFLPMIVAETHRIAPDMMGYDCLTPMFEFLYGLGYSSYCRENEKFVRFIYPNFSTDTFFIHKGEERFPRQYM